MSDPVFWPSTLSQIADIARSVGLGIGGLVAAWIAFKALNLNRRRTDNDTKRLDNEAERLRQQAQALETDRHRLENDTYVKAIEQLGHDKMEVRLGAIYALERIAREAEDFDLHWSIMESLCAYIRERPSSYWGQKGEPDDLDANGEASAVAEAEATSVKEPATADRISRHRRPPTDVAAVFAVLKRRSATRKNQEIEGERRLDFRHTNLSQADLSHIVLECADLSNSCLKAANLSGASLTAR